MRTAFVFTLALLTATVAWTPQSVEAQTSNQKQKLPDDHDKSISPKDFLTTGPMGAVLKLLTRPNTTVSNEREQQQLREFRREQDRLRREAIEKQRQERAEKQRTERALRQHREYVEKLQREKLQRERAERVQRERIHRERVERVQRERVEKSHRERGERIQRDLDRPRREPRERAR